MEEMKKRKELKAYQAMEEDLLEFARSYLPEAFPNPDRKGCPSESSLRLLATQPNEASLSVSEHLAFCSFCFKHYMELLGELRVARASELTGDD